MVPSVIHKNTLGPHNAPEMAPTRLFEVVKKGMFAEIDTEKLVATQTGVGGNGVAGQVTKADGSVEFNF